MKEVREECGIEDTSSEEEREEEDTPGKSVELRIHPQRKRGKRRMHQVRVWN